MWSILKVFKQWYSVFVLFLGFVACQKNIPYAQKISGAALGTTYSLQFVSALEHDQIKKGIDSLFYVANASMSTYWNDSDISKINRGDSTVVVDTHFKAVFEKATEVWKASEGYFDPTVGALVNAYGFGPEKGLPSINKKTKDSLLELTGWDKIQLLPSGRIRKTHPNIYIDFNALAKGYTVDLIANYLSSLGMNDYMVEIGGEIVAKGKSPKSGNFWTIAIDDPQQQKDRTFITTRTLTDQALATSGNYRKYRLDSETGQRFVHSINPRTGNALKTPVLSVSVLAPDCMTADAWATALMVMPLNKAKIIIKNVSNIEAYWVISDEKGMLLEVVSENW